MDVEQYEKARRAKWAKTVAYFNLGTVFLGALLIGWQYGWQTGLGVGLLVWALVPVVE